MKERCYSLKAQRYEHYGGRGIKVCDRWHSFTNFIQDMGERPTKDHSLDRIDNDGNYTPNNCRWATKEEQANNKQELKSSNTSGYKNISWASNVKKWGVRVRINGRRITLGYFNTINEALRARDSKL